MLPDAHPILSAPFKELPELADTTIGIIDSLPLLGRIGLSDQTTIAMWALDRFRGEDVVGDFEPKNPDSRGVDPIASIAIHGLREAGARVGSLRRRKIKRLLQAHMVA